MSVPTDGPRLALVSQKLTGLSGKVNLLLENVPRLREAGFAVDVISQRIDGAGFRRAGAQVVRIMSPPVGRLGRARWFARRAAERTRSGYDLVVAHGEFLSPVDVLHLHCCHHRAQEAMAHASPGTSRAGESISARLQARTISARGFRLLIANSELMRDDLCARYGLPGDVVEVVHPGHDPERFHPDAADPRAAQLRSELGCDLVVGLITSGDFKLRAVSTFLVALSLLPSSLRARVGALVVGKEKHRGPYLELARRASDRVRFLEPRPDVEALYRALDLYVHPAHFEAFGMGVLEAMACGVPVLTSTQVGATELLPQEARRFVMECIEPESLAESMRELLEDERARSELAAAGREASRQRTWAANVAEHVACYRRMLPTASSMPR